MCSDWLKLWKSSCRKLLSRWNCNINDNWVVLYQVCYFCADRKSKMAATGRLSLTLDPIALFECSLDGPIPDLLFWSRSEIARANNNIEAYRALWEFVLSCSFQKVPSQLTWFVPCCS
jgi:hypothetical protein